MGTETRNPLQVTTVSNVANGDYIDITLSSGQRAKCLKSKLLPVVSPSENGLLPKEYAPVYFNGGANYSGILRIAKFTGIRRLSAHLIILTASSIATILIIDIYSRSSADGNIKVKNISGEALPSWAKLLYRIDSVNREFDLVLQITNVTYPTIAINPIFRVGEAVDYMTLTTDDVSTYQPVTIL